MKRSILAGLICCCMLGTVGLEAPAGAATTVATGAELMAAFTDPTVGEIVLGADFTVGCGDGQGYRSNAVALVVRGEGHTVTHRCSAKTQTLLLGNGKLTLTDVTVVGDPDELYSVVYGGGHVIVTDATLTGGGGAALEIQGGSVEVLRSVVAGNIGISVHTGDVLVEDSTVSGGAGPGISDSSSEAGSWQITARRSTVTGGTGISSDHRVVIEQSSVSGSDHGVLVRGPTRIVSSSITGSDYGISAVGTLDLVYSTVAGNGIEPLSGHSIWVGDRGRVRMFGSVIAQSRAPGYSCSPSLGRIISEGYNVTDDPSCQLDHPTDRVIPDVGLSDGTGGGHLAPADDSPLVDAIPLDRCQSGIAAGVTTDAFGRQRPSGLGCDIGAVELDRGPPPTTSTSAPPTSAAPASTTQPVLETGAPPAEPVDALATFTG